MDVTPEGVETVEQFAQLRALGCEFGQGYFFSKPLNSASVEAMLSVNPHWSLLPT
jgi:EAL domain-containing protein (putative c-di-GMP-specific phosphodiesterase class I)